MNLVSIRIIATVCALALLVAACGTNEPSAGGEPEAGTPAEEGGEATEAAGAAGTEPAADGGEISGNLTIWGMGAEGEQLQVIVDMFTEENPDVSVDVTPVAWAQSHERLTTAVAGGQTPDVTQMGTTSMGEFASLGALQETPDSFDPAAFFESAWNTTVVDGTSYGVPWYVDTRMLYYRTDLLEEAGISEPPGTWDELKTAAQALVDEGVSQHGLSLTTGTGSWQTVLPFVWSAGGAIVQDGEFVIDQPPTVDAVEYYASFFEEGLTEPAAPGSDVTQEFVSGSYPMFFSGPWHMELIRDVGGEEMEDAWDIALMPEQESGTSFIGGSNLTVFSESQNSEAAWAFVEFASRPEVQSTWYETVGGLPAVEAAWESGELAEDELLAMWGQQLEDAQGPPTIPTWEEVATGIDRQLEQAAVGGKDPAQAVADMQAAAESVGMGQ